MIHKGIALKRFPIVAIKTYICPIARKFSDQGARLDATSEFKNDKLVPHPPPPSAPSSFKGKDTKDFLQINVPISSQFAATLLTDSPIHIMLNGVRYNIKLTPAVDTQEMLELKRRDMEQAQQELRQLKQKKEALDKAAGKHADRLFRFSLGYLAVQAVVIAKLTFFSRFGWDVMEPITYFITFSVGFGGLIFFHVNHIDYTYSALRRFIVNRKQKKLYTKESFDLGRYKWLKATETKILDEIALLSKMDPTTSNQMADAKTASSSKDVIWQQAIDPLSGQTYYYNPITLESRWDYPT